MGGGNRAGGHLWVESVPVFGGPLGLPTEARLLPSFWSTPHPQCKMQPVLAWKLATSLSSPLAKGQICSTLLENSLPAKQFRDRATGVISGKQNGKERKRGERKKGGEGEKEKTGSVGESGLGWGVPRRIGPILVIVWLCVGEGTVQ